MPVLKPVRGIRLNKSHPLARGLVGYWLFNEGSGNKVFDLSGNRNIGTITSGSWVSGKYGSEVDFAAASTYINCGTNVGNFEYTDSFSIVLWLNPDDLASFESFFGRMQSAGDYRGWEISSGPVDFREYLALTLRNTNTVPQKRVIVRSNTALNTSSLQQIAFTYNGNGAASGVKVYVNGKSVGTTTDDDSLAGNTIQTSAALTIGGRNGGGDYDGTFSQAILYNNKILSASEIAQLYREPFCMFAEAMRPSKMGGQIVNLAGSSVALSSLSATAKAMRKVSGNVVSTTDVTAILNLIRSLLYIESNWKREALFNGMTANAFKLGTTLSLGWFWVRVAGCSVLYRGSSMGEIDFGGVANILAVSERNACEISPPSYISHNSGSTYFYIVRRFNNNGYQEHTLEAAVKVSIKSNGELTEPQPNNIFSSKVEQVANNKVRLTWFYCPLEQGSKPIKFNVYYDDRTGQIDFFENPLAIIEYKGRRFYSFQSSALEAGEEADEHLFAIRAEDVGGIENSSLARLKIQLDTLNPDAIDILRTEAV